MAFGVNRAELTTWKKQVQDGQVAFLTHYWYDPRFPDSKAVTKVGCQDLKKLIEWGQPYGLKAEWIDQKHRAFPHFDLMGERQVQVLRAEGMEWIIQKFSLEPNKN